MAIAILVIGRSNTLKQAATEIAKGVEKTGEKFEFIATNSIPSDKYPLIFLGVSVTEALFGKELKKLSKQMNSQKLAVFTASTALQAKTYFEKQCKKRFKKQILLDTLFLKAKLSIDGNKIVKKMEETDLKRGEGFGERISRKVLNTLPSKDKTAWKQKIRNYKKQ